MPIRESFWEGNLIIRLGLYRVPLVPFLLIPISVTSIGSPGLIFTLMEPSLLRGTNPYDGVLMDYLSFTAVLATDGLMSGLSVIIVRLTAITVKIILV